MILPRMNSLNTKEMLEYNFLDKNLLSSFTNHTSLTVWERDSLQSWVLSKACLQKYKNNKLFLKVSTHRLGSTLNYGFLVMCHSYIIFTVALVNYPGNTPQGLCTYQILLDLCWFVLGPNNSCHYATHKANKLCSYFSMSWVDVVVVFVSDRLTQKWAEPLITYYYCVKTAHDQLKRPLKQPRKISAPTVYECTHTLNECWQYMILLSGQ